MSTEERPSEEVEMALPRGMFGYRAQQVDAVLHAVEAERQTLRSDLSNAQAEIEQLKRSLSEKQSQEAESRAELVHARQQLEQERQSMLHEKELVLNAAHQLADEIQQRAQRRITEEGWELHRARIERQRFVDNFRSLLLKYMEELERLAAAATTSGSAVAEIPPEVFSAAADRLFVPPGFEAPEAGRKAARDRFRS